MKKQTGFTLIEILIVVVIAVSVAAFALPAYKKTQDRANFLAAQGVLMDLGNAVQMLREEVDFPFPAAARSVMKNWQENSSIDPEETAPVTGNAHYFLFLRKYLSPIPFNVASLYKNYRFVLCPENTASSSYCCNGDSNVVVCMYDSGYANRATKGEYYGALYYKDNHIERISKIN